MPDLANPQALNGYAYVLGNSLGYADPSGHAYDAGGPSGMPPADEKDPWYRQTAEFLMGAATQYCDDLAIGVPSFIQRALSGGTGPEDYTSDAFQSGRQFGRYASYGYAVASIAMGSVETAGSGALEAVTVGGATPVAVPVAAVGVGEVAHGSLILGHNFANPIAGSSSQSGQAVPQDYQVHGVTKQETINFCSEREARAFARRFVGRDPLIVEEGKWRSQNGKWRYRALPDIDVSKGHIHLEELDPNTGLVVRNFHLTWP